MLCSNLNYDQKIHLREVETVIMHHKAMMILFDYAEISKPSKLVNFLHLLYTFDVRLEPLYY